MSKARTIRPERQTPLNGGIGATGRQNKDASAAPGSPHSLELHRALVRLLTRARRTEEAAIGLISIAAAEGPWSYGALWGLDAERKRLTCVETWTEGSPALQEFARVSEQTSLGPDEGLPGQVWLRGAPVWLEDFPGTAWPRAAAATRAGLVSAVAVPVLRGETLIAVLELMSRGHAPVDRAKLEMLLDIAEYLALFIERRSAEEATRSADAVKAAILGAALDAVVTIDRHGRILDFNPAAEESFGYPRAEVLGRPLSETIIPPELREAHARGMARHLATGEARILGRRIEIQAMRAGGETFPVELTVVRTDPIPGAPVFAAYIRDITQRKRQEAQLREHAEQLRQQHLQKDAFVAMLAHELRNPLAPIANAAHILRHTVLPGEPAAGAAQVIERQTRNLARLVEDLLDMSRISRGAIVLRRAPSTIGALVDGALEISGPVLQARGLRLDVRVEDRDATLHVDATRIVQVISNLLNNAAKFTPEGGQVFLEAVRSGEDALFRVRDTGRGIDPGMLSQIFDLFVQADPGAGGGLGIGLTLGRELARLHGGSLSAASEGPGKGATFELRVPVRGRETPA